MNLKPIALAALMLMATPARPQSTPAPVEETSAYQQINLVAAEQNFVAALRSGNDGAVESALGIIARVKLSLPERRFASVEAECVRLITEGPTESIRYKSYLVLNLLGHPRSFSAESRNSYDDANEMFSAIASRLQLTNRSFSSVAQ